MQAPDMGFYQYNGAIDKCTQNSMIASLDLFILPLAGPGGEDQGEFPGLYLASPPRRAARGRDRDSLILYLAFAGTGLSTAEETSRLLRDLAKTYYGTSGTVTAAQRSVAEYLNQFLLDHNYKPASGARQAVGLLTQVVLRSGRLALAQSGPTHAYLLRPGEVQHFYDPQFSGRGLGLSRTTALRFSQAGVSPNDFLLLTPQPPPAWSVAFLQSAQSQGLESLRRRLLSKAPADISAVLIQAHVGKGRLHLESDARDLPAYSVAKPGPEPSPEVAHQQATPDQETHSRSFFQPLFSALAFLGEVAGSSLRMAARLFLRFLTRLLPDSGLFTLPSSTMAFVAVAVPIVVVAVTSFVYFQRGRAAQYQHYFSQAVQAAEQAENLGDPQEQRLAWAVTLAHLDQTEFYQKTESSQALRSRAQGILDSLDYVERLDYLPAIPGRLKEGAHISRMVTNDNDLYLLNAKEGLVLRATLTGSGYVIDPTFECGPGPYGGIIVGAIIDIVPMPRGNDLRATLAGIDANGNLLYCLPGDAPFASPLAPPDINWSRPAGLTIDSGDLYILDTQTNAVWIYRGMDVARQPRLFFGQQIPSLQGVIDQSVNRNDLYLLFTDGRITTCAFSALLESPTRCEDPANYSDPRPGRSSGPVIEGAHFTEILFAPPPDPSIYLLEPNSRAVYHFSVRLTFQRQFQSNTALPPGPATAFTISHNNRTVFLAFGNEVYYAALP